MYWHNQTDSHRSHLVADQQVAVVLCSLAHSLAFLCHHANASLPE
jgi:hypothetical protein